MSYFKFEDRTGEVKRAFNAIARTEGDKNRIDSSKEQKLMSLFLQKYRDNMSSFDIALFESGSLDFDNKQIKKQYKSLARSNGKKKKLDSEQEIKHAKEFLNANRQNMSDNDIRLFENMIQVQEQRLNINIDIEGNNNRVDVSLVLPPEVMKSLYPVSLNGQNISLQDRLISSELPSLNWEIASSVQPKSVISDPVAKPSKDLKSSVNKSEIEHTKELKSLENNSEEVQEVSLAPQHNTSGKVYKYKQGDYWYKIVQENYNTSSPKEIMQIVRKIKDAYYEKHIARLTRLGHQSSKSGFFLRRDEEIILPQNVQIMNGKTITLK